MNSPVAKRRLQLAALLAEANAVRREKSEEYPTTPYGVLVKFFPNYDTLPRYDVVLKEDIEFVAYILNAKVPSTHWTGSEYLDISEEAVYKLDDIVMGDKARKIVSRTAKIIVGGLCVFGWIAMARK